MKGKKMKKIIGISAQAVISDSIWKTTYLLWLQTNEMPVRQ